MVFLSNQVLNRDLHVVQLDESSPGRDLPRDFETAHVNPRVVFERDDKEGNACCSRTGGAGADGHGGVVGPDAVCDPFLGAVYNVVLPVGGFLGRSHDPGHVGAGLGFCDGDADSFSAQEDVGDDFFLEDGGAELEDEGEAEGDAGCEGAWGAGEAGADHFVAVDVTVKGVKVFYFQAAEEGVDAEFFEPGCGQGGGEGGDEHVVVGKGGKDGFGDGGGGGLLGFDGEGVEVGGDEGADDFGPLEVGRGEVGGGEAHEGGGVGEGDGGFGGHFGVDDMASHGRVR